MGRRIEDGGLPGLTREEAAELTASETPLYGEEVVAMDTSVYGPEGAKKLDELRRRLLTSFKPVLWTEGDSSS